jgi:cytochrome c-type biogenesis protein CcmH
MNALLMLAVLIQPTNARDLEQRVMMLSQQFRCLVCQNETIADSHADLAADLRQQIREQMTAGRSDAQISTFLTDRYGEFILYRPRVTPKTYALWFGPFLVLGGSLYGLYVFVKRSLSSTSLRTLTTEDHQTAKKLLRNTTDFNIAVYRDQFAELESDLRTGLVARPQYEREREELERRLLEDCRELRGVSF